MLYFIKIFVILERSTLHFTQFGIKRKTGYSCVAELITLPTFSSQYDVDGRKGK
jgi:hypothetical protein